MAMTAASMMNRIQNNISAITPVQGGADNPAYRNSVMQAMCQGIIDEIKANAVVTVTSVNGVTPGGGTSGPGTGTVSA